MKKLHPTVIIERVFRHFPLQNAIIFETSPYAGNTEAFFRYLTQQTQVQEKYRFYWFCNSPKESVDRIENVPVRNIYFYPDTKLQRLKKLYVLNTAKFIIDCSAFIYKKRDDQVRVHLFHGMSFKTVPEYIKKRGKADFATITSHIFDREVSCDCDTQDTLVDCGMPRNDILARKRGKRQTKTKAIIWMPTYRQFGKNADLSIENRLPFGFPLIREANDFSVINEELKKLDMTLYLRPHPVQDLSFIHFSDYSNIVLCNDAYIDRYGGLLYDFLANETDALITDYSSVYYDYLLLDRPIALCWEDIDAFRKRWKLYFDDPEDRYHCQRLETVDDLILFMRRLSSDDDPFYEGRQQDLHAYFTYPDDRASERLYKLLKEKKNL